MVSVNDEEINALKELEKLGIEVTFHFVPNDIEEPMSYYID